MAQIMRKLSSYIQGSMKKNFARKRLIVEKKEKSIVYHRIDLQFYTCAECVQKKDHL